MLLCSDFTIFAGWIDMKYNNAGEKFIYTDGITNGCILLI